MGKQFRIGMIAACPFPAQRGTPVRIYRVSEALAKNGHDVHVLTYHFGESQSEPPFRIHRIPSLPFYRRFAAGPTYTKLFLMDPLLAVKIRKVILKYGIDLIHAHHYEGLLASIPASKFSVRPVIYDAHTLLENELPSYSMALPNSIKRMAGKYLDRRLPKFAKHIISVSEEIRQYLIRKAGIDPIRITTIPNGVEFERFDRQIHERTPGHKTKRIVYTGNFAAYQGIDLLLKAFMKICEKTEDINLYLVSSFSFDAYEKLAAQLGIRDRIRVISCGFDEVPVWLNRADVAVNPRIVCDGLPQKLLNYMAAGKPLVSFSGSAKLIEHNKTGWIVENGDLDAFAQGILFLLRNPEKADELGRNAQQYVLAECTWKRVAEKMAEIYELTLNNQLPSQGFI
jgi:glycosyltransferase involved in cell wall biosynthesis